MPLTVTEQATTSSHAYLVSATKGCEGNGMNTATPSWHQSYLRTIWEHVGIQEKKVLFLLSHQLAVNAEQ